MNNDKSMNLNEQTESSRIVSERGRTVIPKPIRDYMDLQAGDKLVWTVNEQGAVIVHAMEKKSIMGLKGIVRKEYSADDFNNELAKAKEQHYLKRNEVGGSPDA